MENITFLVFYIRIHIFLLHKTNTQKSNKTRDLPFEYILAMKKIFLNNTHIFLNFYMNIPNQVSKYVSTHVLHTYSHKLRHKRKITTNTDFTFNTYDNTSL